MSVPRTEFYTFIKINGKSRHPVVVFLEGKSLDEAVEMLREAYRHRERYLTAKGSPHPSHLPNIMTLFDRLKVEINHLDLSIKRTMELEGVALHYQVMTRISYKVEP